MKGDHWPMFHLWPAGRHTGRKVLNFLSLLLPNFPNNYTNSLVNTTFQKIPIPHLSNPYYETEIPSLTRIFLHFVLMNLHNLLNMIFCLTRLFSRTKSSVNQGFVVIVHLTRNRIKQLDNDNSMFILFLWFYSDFCICHLWISD